MAIYTLTINAQTPAFGGGNRRGERQQIRDALRAASEALGPGQFSGNITDINRAPGTAIAVIGSWSYTPVASGGE